MKDNVKTDFCISCRRERPYSLKKETIRKTIRGRKYDFSITTAVCEAAEARCVHLGSLISIPVQFTGTSPVHWHFEQVKNEFEQVTSRILDVSMIRIHIII